MNKKALVSTLFMALLLSGFIPVALPMNGQGQYEMTIGTIGEPETVDPAKAYDTASSELIWSVYDPLIFFDGELMNQFIPRLATDWTYDEVNYVWTFTIREGVAWHDPAYGTVTPEDVEYSIERLMVEDYLAGPQWMVFEPFWLMPPYYGANLTDPTYMTVLDNAVTVSGNTVSFHLGGPYSTDIFLQVWSQAWASILCKQWAIDQGCWDGQHTQESLLQYHEPAVSPLDDPDPVMMGNGPYKFDAWIKGSGGYWTIIKNDDYWGGWPAYHPVLKTQCRGYVTRFTSQYVEEWATRKLLFLGGDLDFNYVPRLYMGDVWAQPGIKSIYPLPSQIAFAIFFNFEIVSESRYLRPPWSVELAAGTFDEDGIPPDFFSDKDIRWAFAKSCDYGELVDIAFLGEALYPATPAIVGLPYRKSGEWYSANQHVFDLALAEQLFRSAWGGQVWDTGFTLTLLVNEGNVPRKTYAEIVEANVESLNPKFHIEVVELPWGEVLLPEYKRGELPTYIVGWLGDYPDPHNWWFTFLHSQGVYAGPGHYVNEYADALIEEGAVSIDPVRRQEIYYELQDIYVEDVPSIMVMQPTGRHWEQMWVQGWFYNPAGPGAIGEYPYYLWKEDLPETDINDSGGVDILDIVAMAIAFGSYYTVGDVHAKWNSKVDLNLDRVVDIFDVVTIAKDFGFESPDWIPPT